MRILFWFLLLAAAAVGVALRGQAHQRLRAVRRAAVPRRDLAQSVPAARSSAASSAATGSCGSRSRTAALPARSAGAAAQAAARSARAASRMLPSSRCSKADTARRASSPRKRSTSRNRPGFAALVAARAALDTRDFATAEALLTRSAVQTRSLAVPRLMLDAEMKLEQGRPIEALATLQLLKQGGGLAHRGAATRAARAAGRRPLRGDPAARRPARQAQGVRRAAKATTCAAAAHAEELAARTHDPAGLRAYWSKLTDTEQRTPKLARAAARSFASWAAIARPRRSCSEASSGIGSPSSSPNTPNAGRRSPRGSSPRPSAG